MDSYCSPSSPLCPCGSRFAGKGEGGKEGGLLANTVALMLQRMVGNEKVLANQK